MANGQVQRGGQLCRIQTRWHTGGQGEARGQVEGDGPRGGGGERSRTNAWLAGGQAQDPACQPQPLDLKLELLPALLAGSAAVLESERKNGVKVISNSHVDFELEHLRVCIAQKLHVVRGAAAEGLLA